MKRLAAWAGVCIGAVVVQMGVTFRFLVPRIDDFAYLIRWSSDVKVVTGWQALTPYYAWPILVTYSGALLVLGSVIAVAVGRSTVQRERQAIAEHEAAAAAQVQEARHALAEARGIQQAAQDEARAAMEEVARREKEANEQVEQAEFRLKRSVDTNIGLHRQIQRLKKQPE